MDEDLSRSLQDIKLGVQKCGSNIELLDQHLRASNENNAQRFKSLEGWIRRVEKTADKALDGVEAEVRHDRDRSEKQLLTQTGDLPLLDDPDAEKKRQKMMGRREKTPADRITRWVTGGGLAALITTIGAVVGSNYKTDDAERDARATAEAQERAAEAQRAEWEAQRKKWREAREAREKSEKHDAQAPPERKEPR